MQLTVQDSGIGISAEDPQRLFEPFAQAQNSHQLAIAVQAWGWSSAATSAK